MQVSNIYRKRVIFLLIIGSFRIIEFLVYEGQLPNQYRASITDLKDPVRIIIGVRRSQKVEREGESEKKGQWVLIYFTFRWIKLIYF